LNGVDKTDFRALRLQAFRVSLRTTRRLLNQMCGERDTAELQVSTSRNSILFPPVEMTMHLL
jgi:hypothetical protein